MIGMLGQVGVLIPCRIGAVVPVGDLHIANPGLAHPAGHQALPAKGVGLLRADAVELLRLGCFLRQVEDVRSVSLHLPAQFKGLNHRLGLGVAGGAFELLGMQFLQQVELAAL